MNIGAPSSRRRPHISDAPIRTSAAALLVVLFALAPLGARVNAEPPPAAVPAYRVIVNPKNPFAQMDGKFLEDAFLKRTTRWSNNQVIRPADLPASAVARARFS